MRWMVRWPVCLAATCVPSCWPASTGARPSSAAPSGARPHSPGRAPRAIAKRSVCEAAASRAGRERHGVLIPARQPRLKVGKIGVEVAAAWPAHGAFGKAVGIGELAHRRACQASGVSDGKQRLASQAPPPHVLIGRKPAGTAIGADSVIGGAAAVGTGALACLPPVTPGRRRRGPQARMGAGQPAFQRSAHIRQKMPAVCDLNRFGRPWRWRGRSPSNGRGLRPRSQAAAPAMPPRSRQCGPAAGRRHAAVPCPPRWRRRSGLCASPNRPRPRCVVRLAQAAANAGSSAARWPGWLPFADDPATGCPPHHREPRRPWPVPCQAGACGEHMGQQTQEVARQCTVCRS